MVPVARVLCHPFLPRQTQLRAAFDAIDTSGDGSLDAGELLSLFNRLADDDCEEEEPKVVSPGLIANLIRLADDDGSGTIEWAEFIKIFRILGKMQMKQAIHNQHTIIEAKTRHQRISVYHYSSNGEFSMDIGRNRSVKRWVG